ncbi:hypothetical protein PRV_01935 [Mycoplasma parvum str. Indiana]|uniref:Uncharacterized protein n=1 Tax=Mycoplasma parvum str. Indiana TaxID=1403316 RepID=U5NCR3_9MOLU|nr:hypothetical protein PRV_01935 [Mycoplasma parvum str. Indiana]
MEWWREKKDMNYKNFSKYLIWFSSNCFSKSLEKTKATLEYLRNFSLDKELKKFKEKIKKIMSSKKIILKIKNLISF